MALSYRAIPNPVLFPPPPAGGAVVHDASSSSSGNGVSSLTFSHTCTGTNRALVVGISATQDVTNVTYAGVALTFQRVDIDASYSFRTEIWAMAAPASGANNVVITLAAAGDVVGGAESVTGAHQTTPFSGATGATATSTTPSVTVTSAANDMVVDTVMSLFALTVGAGQTQRWNTSIAGLFGAGSTEPGAASVTMSWTMASDSWAISAVNVKAA